MITFYDLIFYDDKTVLQTLISYNNIDYFMYEKLYL